VSWLNGYKRPNDKIHALLHSGFLEYVKKGLYIAGPMIKAAKPEPFLLANHILGPSYVSLDSALSYHGFIPERVYGITSMTTKASRKFQTSGGVFSYTRLALPYYAFGIIRVKLAVYQYALIASPEKALCDKIISTSGLLVRSKKSVMHYLLNDLRIDEDTIKSLNTRMIAEWLTDAPKRESLFMFIKAINNL